MNTNKSMQAITALVALALPCLFGCSTKPVVYDITSTLNSTSSTKIEGVPFRIHTDHRVTIFGLSDDSDKYTKLAQSTQRLADMNRLFAINYSGGPFATNMLKVVQNSDNTLKSMALASTDTSDKTIDAITSAVTGNAAKKTAAVTSAKAVVEGDKAVRDAQKELDALPNTASTDTRALYERILESAKEQAAAARAAAGN